MTTNQCAAADERLPPGWLVGTWEFTHTTAPACFPCEFVYHFDRTGTNYWEMPFERRLAFQRPYREQEDGFWIHWKTASYFHHCQPSFDEVLAVGIDGNLWWMRRLLEPAPYLRYFIDPRTGALVEVADCTINMAKAGDAPRSAPGNAP